MKVHTGYFCRLEINQYTVQVQPNRIVGHLRGREECEKKSITVKVMLFKDNSHYFEGNRGRRDFFEELDIKIFDFLKYLSDIFF